MVFCLWPAQTHLDVYSGCMMKGLPLLSETRHRHPRNNVRSVRVERAWHDWGLAPESKTPCTLLVSALPCPNSMGRANVVVRIIDAALR